MVTEQTPSGEPQSSPESDIAAILERPEVQAAILTASAKASDETKRDLEAQHRVKTQEWEKVKSGWAVERAKHAIEIKAHEKSADADSLKAAFLEAEAEKAAAAQLKEEAQALIQGVAREKAVAKAITGFKVAFPGLDAAFWDKATDRMVKGEADSSTIITEAAAFKAKPQQPGQPTGLANGGGGRDPSKQIMDNYIKNPTPANRKAYESVRGS